MIVDRKSEGVLNSVVVELELPLQHVSLHLHWERAGLRKLLASHDFFLLHKLEFQKLALLLVRGNDDVSRVIVDSVKLD